MAGKSDYGKLRDRYMAHQKRREEGMDDRWWKPDTGTAGGGPMSYRIRILPPFDGHDSWYLQYGVHYRIKGEGEQFISITCPQKTMNKPCPICEFTKGLWKGSEGDQKVARDIGSKTRYASNILILSSTRGPNDPKIWGYGPKVWEPLNQLCVGSDDGDFVPIDDPVKGFNMKLSIAVKATEEGNFPEYTIVPDGMKATAIPDKNSLDRLHNLNELIVAKVKSYDEIRSILLGAPTEMPPAKPVQKPVQQKMEEAAKDDSSAEEVVSDVDGGEEVIEETTNVQESSTAQAARRTPADIAKLARAALEKRQASAK